MIVERVYRYQLAASETVSWKWSFSISLNPLFCWTIFWCLVKRQSLPLKHKSLHSWLQFVDLTLWGSALALGPAQPMSSHRRSPNAPQPTSPPTPLPSVWSIVFLPFLLRYLNSVSPAFALAVSLMFFSSTSWVQTSPSASKLIQFGPYSPISDDCPPHQELRFTQPLAHRLLTQLSVRVSFLQMDKNWSRFGPRWVFVRHVAYFSLR